MSSIIEGRKPEYTHNSCRNCKAELEYLSTSVPVTVRCYSCKQNSTFEATSASKANGAGSKKLFTKRKIGSDKEPLETEYYDLLGVEPTADASEIKKQYYKLALKFHPDKNSSPEAEQKFKKISVAYQVLSDPALRKKYNEFGSGNNDVEPEGGFVNPEDFFRQQFGGDRFVDIIGEISIGRDMKEVLQNAQDEEEKMNGAITDDESSRREAKTVQDEERDRIRKERVEKLVANLIHKLSIYVETDDPEGYRKMIEMEADELKTESYGIELLHAIGFTYSLKAKQYLGGEQMLGLPRFAHIVREKGHVFTETISTLRSAIDLQQSFTQLQEAEKKGLDADEMKELEKATANKGLTALWKGSKLEVEGVLRQVCDQVLSDSRASKAELRKRAEGLKIIGHVYETAKAHDDQLGGRGQ